MQNENRIIHKITGYTLWLLAYSPGLMKIGRSYNDSNNIFTTFYIKLRKYHAG
jgi:hypothetical protein